MQYPNAGRIYKVICISALRKSIGTAFCVRKRETWTTDSMNTAKAVQILFLHNSLRQTAKYTFLEILEKGLPDSFAHYCWESTLSLRLRRLVCEGHSLLCRYLEHASYLYMTSHAVSPRCITCRHNWHAPIATACLPQPHRQGRTTG